jgi:hypothetical protein
MVSNQAKANTVTVQALRAGADPRDLELARQYMGVKKFIGYCQAFVNRVSGGKTSGASAIEAWNKAPTRIQGTQGIQPGDLVYFSPNASNRGYGHTGIYEGNGKFISATNSGIRSSDLMGWLKSTGQKLLGYVPGDRTLGLGGQQGSQSTPLAFNPQTPEQNTNRSVQTRQIPIPPSPQMLGDIQTMGRQRIPTINLNPGSNIAQNA